MQDQVVLNRPKETQKKLLFLPREHGATATRSMESRAGSLWASITRCVSAHCLRRNPRAQLALGRTCNVHRGICCSRRQGPSGCAGPAAVCVEAAAS